MIFIGVDIAKNKHCAVAVDESGHELSKVFPFDNTEDGFSGFFDLIADCMSKDAVCVAMEATGHYWLNLYAFLFDKGVEVHVFNPIQTDAIRRMNIRKTKTDSIDCKCIADVVRIGNYSDIRPQSDDIIQLRQLCRFRYGLVDSVASLKNQVIGILDRLFPEYKTCFSDVFGVASMTLLEKYTSPETMLKVPTRRLAELLSKHSRGAFGEDKAKQLKEVCKRSVGIRTSTSALEFSLKMTIEQIAFIEEQIKKVEEKITEIYEQCNCYLHTIIGVGKVSAAVILSEIGDINNFESPKKLVAFAGLDPSVAQSGNYESSRNKMSKRGSPYLRRAIWNCAVTSAQFNPVMMAFYEKKRAQGKNYMVSIGAVSHKLCGAIFAVLRDQKPYVPIA